jgi:N-acetylglucosamine-6-phosphate deacetylase
MKLLENIAIPTEHIERGWIRIDGARIAGIGAGDAPDAQEGADPSVERIDGGGMSALPGFIDVHVHGSNTADTMDATARWRSFMPRTA